MDKIDFAPPFSSIGIEAAQKLADYIDSDLLEDILEIGKRTENVDFGPEMAPHILSEQQFYQCYFVEVPFSGINASHIILKSCQLQSCKVENSNFKFSDFTGSSLSLTATASSFDFSDFSEANISDACFKGCSLSGSNFYKSTLFRSKFVNSEFVGASFLNSSFNNLRMIKTNLDYAEFEETEFSDVIFPYWSTLHVVRGLPEILLSNKVAFSTPNGKHCVQSTQYMEEISLLRPFFYQKGDYLALANSYLIEGEHRQAYDAIIRGINNACHIGKLSLLRHLCRLASLNNFFSRQEMRKLYEAVENTLAVTELTPMQYKNYLQELDAAKRLLIDCPFGQDVMDITIQTSIACNDYKRLSSTLELIDSMVIKNVPKIVDHIEVRHNSPIVITVTVCGALGSLLFAFCILDFIFDKSSTYIERVQNIIKNHRDLHQKENSTTIDNLEKQVAEMKDEMQKLKQQTAENYALILPGTTEFQRISYKLSSAQIIPEELRSYSITRR